MESSTQSSHRKSPVRQGSSPIPPKRSLEWLVGRRVKIKTTTNEEIDGLIYTFDRITNCLALDCSTGPRHSRKGLSFRIVKIPQIKEILSVTSDENSTPLQDPAIETNINKLSSYLPVNAVNLDRLRGRESDAMKGHLQQAAKIGVGVTKEAQDIFDALAKTLPCRWSNDTIIVLDEVLISPPYEVENCKANASAAASLARVKKVLEGERRRLASAKN
ncbi:anticodon-binding domain-containing protein [Radiomyces spectabilis]|uniref:anticodon-binding domain-containing protein n=1 Tax=Radiomyces spectabilis TaxID=64574 RepID=UPI002220066A|nr:anticodon-binding domain-containing protein [Radiomyces spectabilis]KAI8390866.1 anticodon-binding domain-containing protein [Radiomyces spectabilis]